MAAVAAAVAPAGSEGLDWCRDTEPEAAVEGRWARPARGVPRSGQEGSGEGCVQERRKAPCRGSSDRGSLQVLELARDAVLPEEAGWVRLVRYPGRWGRVPVVPAAVAEARFGRVQPVRCPGSWDTEQPAVGAVLAGAREVEVAHFGQVPQAEGGSSQEKAASHRQDSCWSRRRRGCWRLDKGRRDRSDDFRKSWAVFLGWKSDRVAQ